MSEGPKKTDGHQESHARVWLYERTPRIELRQLRSFLVIAEELNFTRAAVRLGIAQSPLSQQIKSLEHQLKVQLFIRDKRQVSLTREGETLVVHARELINKTLLATELVRAIARGEEGPLVIGSIFSAIYSVMPRLLPEFKRRYPGINLHLQEMTVPQQLSALADGGIDVGLLRGPVADPELEAVTLLHDPFVAVVPTTHVFAGKESLTLREVASQPLIGVLPSANRDYSRRMFGALRDAGYSLNIVQEVSDTHTLLGLVAANFGVSLVPASIQNIQLDTVRYIPLSEPTPITHLQAVRRKDSLLRATTNFLKLVGELYTAPASL